MNISCFKGKTQITYHTFLAGPKGQLFTWQKLYPPLYHSHFISLSLTLSVRETDISYVAKIVRPVRRVLSWKHMKGTYSQSNYLITLFLVIWIYIFSWLSNPYFPSLTPSLTHSGRYLLLPIWNCPNFWMNWRIFKLQKSKLPKISSGIQILESDCHHLSPWKIRQTF